MQINTKFIFKHIHQIAIEQISDEYIRQGYKIEKEILFGKYKADIVAKKENEKTIVIEVKSSKFTPIRREKFIDIANYVKNQKDCIFRVVVATLPIDKKIEIEDMANLIFSYISLHGIPSSLDELSTHTQILEINDVSISYIKLEKNIIFIEGNGIAALEMQFGSDGDLTKGDGLLNHENVPFFFNSELELDEKNALQIIKLNSFKIDKSYLDYLEM